MADKTHTQTEQHYRAKTVAIKQGVSVATIWRHVRLGSFPPPIRPFPRVTVWRKSDIDAWLATKTTGGAK